MRGYPNLAAFQDSSQNFMLYRRYGYLQARVLLNKQDALSLLEKELEQFDRDNEGCSVSCRPNEYTQDAIDARNKLLLLIDEALSSYGKIVAHRDLSRLTCLSAITIHCARPCRLQQAKRLRASERLNFPGRF